MLLPEGVDVDEEVANMRMRLDCIVTGTVLLILSVGRVEVGAVARDAVRGLDRAREDAPLEGLEVDMDVGDGANNNEVVRPGCVVDQVILGVLVLAVLNMEDIIDEVVFDELVVHIAEDEVWLDVRG
jgi:hypothetical protein